MTKSKKTEIDIDYVSNLARIALTAEEKEEFASQLGGILEHFDKLAELNVDDVEPSAHAFSVYNVFQDGEIQSPFTPEEALLNAPKQRNNQVIVPKVVE